MGSGNRLNCQVLPATLHGKSPRGFSGRQPSCCNWPALRFSIDTLQSSRPEFKSIQIVGIWQPKQTSDVVQSFGYKKSDAKKNFMLHMPTCLRPWNSVIKAAANASEYWHKEFEKTALLYKMNGPRPMPAVPDPPRRLGSRQVQHVVTGRQSMHPSAEMAGQIDCWREHLL